MFAVSGYRSFQAVDHVVVGRRAEPQESDRRIRNVGHHLFFCLLWSEIFELMRL